MIRFLFNTFLLCSGSDTASVCITRHAVATAPSDSTVSGFTDERKDETCGRTALAVDNKTTLNNTICHNCSSKKKTLTHSSPQFWHPGHVSHQGHCRLLQAGVCWIQHGGDDRQTVQFLSKGLTHHSGHLDRDPEFTWRTTVVEFNEIKALLCVQYVQGSLKQWGSVTLRSTPPEWLHSDWTSVETGTVEGTLCCTANSHP